MQHRLEVVWLSLGRKEIPPAVLVLFGPGERYSRESGYFGGFVLLAAGTKEAGKLSQLAASRCISWQHDGVCTDHVVGTSMFSFKTLSVLCQGSIPRVFGLCSSPQRGPQGVISVCHSSPRAAAAEACFVTAECMNFYLGCAGVAIKVRLLGMKHFQSSAHH